MQDQLNSIKYTSTITPDDIRKNMLMKKVLLFVQAKEEHPELKKPQLCQMIGISDSSLKRIMKDLNMKSFYHHKMPVNKKKKLSSMGGAEPIPWEPIPWGSSNDISEVEKAPIEYE